MPQARKPVRNPATNRQPNANRQRGCPNKQGMAHTENYETAGAPSQRALKRKSAAVQGVATPLYEPQRNQDMMTAVCAAMAEQMTDFKANLFSKMEAPHHTMRPYQAEVEHQ